jgi:hypothetical protein
VAVVLLDATAGEEDATVAALAAPLLASRGVLVLSVRGGTSRAAGERPGGGARRERRGGASPRARRACTRCRAPAGGKGVGLPPGVPVRDDSWTAARRASRARGTGLLERLGARPRVGPPAAD